MLPVKVLYCTEATATGGRVGQSTTPDGKSDVMLATPKEPGGAGGAGVNPEQLFAVVYATCSMGAMKFTAAKDKVRLSAEPKVTADVGIGPRYEGQGFGPDVELKISLPGLDAETADKVIHGGDTFYPCSHAIMGRVNVKLTRI